MRAYEHGELMTEEDSLAHYGVAGMKWGVRGSKKTTGMSRTQGALKDRNDRRLKSFNEAKAGLENNSGSRTTKAINITNRMTMGKTVTKQHYDTNISKLNDQNDRITSGKATVRDRLTAALTIPPAQLLISIRPKD